ncbi:MAG: carbohydrate ABC transporter permease [Candidatus Izemoplasmatales bacterium]|jgi:ABC-type glycerol-3-phosphate transport system permease component|nr:carbohydrate ABC transporter permease [Candidatus Izemoplasmatales bacterium]MDY0373523.1 carbohydrate ABC transporter permease [Candidatus Izemoplasmatales bacterium]
MTRVDRQLTETEKIVRKLRNKRRNRKSKFLGTKINPTRLNKSQIKFFLLVLPMLIVTSLPLIFIFSHAFKPLDQLYAYPPKIFASRLTLDNFQNLFTLASQTGVPFSRYLFNSLLVSGLVIFLTIALGSAAAFAFSFLKFKGKKGLFLINQIAIIIVPVAIAVPRFIVMSTLGVTNTMLAHVIPLIAMPVGVFLIKQFMDQVPVELFEASKIDGANNFQIYLKIVMPLVKPALATVMILSFQNAWNNVQTSNLYVNDEALKTLPYYFSALTIGTNPIAAQGMAAAANLIIFVPNVVLFIILQNSVMNTMAHSGIK